MKLAACPGTNNGTCHVGYHGPTCGVCELGYHLTDDGCVKCVGGTKYMLPIAIAAAIVASALAVWIMRKFDTKKVVGVMQILVSYFQVMGSSSTAYNIPWPDFMLSMYEQMTVFMLDLFQVTAVDCWIPTDFYVPFFSTTVGTQRLEVSGVCWCFSLHWPCRM
jgi:hypothetical protein